MPREPPPAGHRGHYSYFLDAARHEPLSTLLHGSPAHLAAESLIIPAKFEPPEQVQVSLNIPPFNHRPGGPHIYGLAPPELSGRPGTFTLLAGIFLTAQAAEWMGTLLKGYPLAFGRLISYTLAKEIILV